MADEQREQDNELKLVAELFQKVCTPVKAESDSHLYDVWFFEQNKKQRPLERKDIAKETAIASASDPKEELDSLTPKPRTPGQ